jgi:TadE-like protein
MAADTQRGFERVATRGSALVEASLVLSLFVLLLVAVIDCGQVLFMHNTLGDRLRQALRYASVNADDIHGVQNIVLYGRLAEAARESYGLSRDGVSVVREQEGTAHDRILIRVNGYSVRFLTPLIRGTRFGRPLVASIPVESF